MAPASLLSPGCQAQTLSCFLLVTWQMLLPLRGLAWSLPREYQGLLGCASPISSPSPLSLGRLTHVQAAIATFQPVSHTSPPPVRLRLSPEYLIVYLLSPLGSLEGNSNSACPNRLSRPKPAVHLVFSILVSNITTYFITRARTWGGSRSDPPRIWFSSILASKQRW